MRHVYILRCCDDTLYTGITNDIEKRTFDHNNSTCGARYTKSRRPVKLIWKKRMKDKVAAMKMEYKVKRLSRAKKEELVESLKVRKVCKVESRKVRKVESRKVKKIIISKPYKT